jgi:hypothetical protein
MKRLSRIIDARTADGGAAAVLKFEIVDTQSGKASTEAFEVVRHNMRDILGSSLAVCSVFGRVAPEERPLSETTPSQALPIPAGELAVKQTASGGLLLMFRVGSVDLSVALPDAKAAEVLANALLNPS